MKIEFEENQFLFFLSYMLCMIDAILIGYSAFGSIPGIHIVSRIMCVLAFVTILIKLLADGYYPVKELLILSVAGMILLIVYLQSGYNHIFYFLIVFLGMRGVKAEQIIKWDFIIKIILMLLIITSALTGIIEHYVTYRTGESILRYSVGFNHPNTFAGLVLSLILEEAYLSKRKPNVFYVLVVWIVDVVVYLVSANRTAVLLIALFPIILLGISGSDEQLINRHKGGVFVYSYPIMVVISFVVMKFTQKKVFITAIDRLFSNRFYNAEVLFSKYGISILGQKVELISVKSARLLHSSIALLDVAFLRILIQGGVLVLFVFCVFYCLACKTAILLNDRWFIGIVFVFMMFGLFESGSNNVYMNFSILLVIENLYRNEALMGVE